MAQHDSPLITGKDQLIDWLAEGETPQQDWKIGTEHEKFLFEQNGLKRPAYEGDAGVGALSAIWPKNTA